MESYDEKGFKLCVRSGVEVLTFLIELEVKGPLGQPVYLELLYFAEF